MTPAGWSLLHEFAETRKGGVPLLRDEIEVAAGVLKALLIQLPEALTSAPRATHKAGVLHHAQMLGDGLTGDSGACGEPANGGGSLLAKAHHEL